MDIAFTSFVLGYHGCDASIAETVFSGRTPLRPSHNDYDWLGDGIYFWEHNPSRAFEFARDVSRRPHPSRQQIKSPAVVGAIIELRFCLNLLDGRFIEMIREAHAELVRLTTRSGTRLPRNTGGKDLFRRNLDCAVLRMLHELRADADQPGFDTVRAAFLEGSPIYENAGFNSKSHLQLCVRNPACIKGYFRPLDDQGNPMKFG